jgi:hypothetical protein
MGGSRFAGRGEKLTKICHVHWADSLEGSRRILYAKDMLTSRNSAVKLKKLGMNRPLVYHIESEAVAGQNIQTAKGMTVVNGHLAI